jgi:hypothetical protein
MRAIVRWELYVINRPRLRGLFICALNLAYFGFFLCGAQRGMPNTAYSAPLEENPNYTQIESTRATQKLGIWYNIFIMAETKQLKFADPLAVEIVHGRKNKTWRVDDDKDLQLGDKLWCMHGSTGRLFAAGRITDVQERTFGTLTESDFEGHEPVGDEESMLAMYSGYYGKDIRLDTVLKVVEFSLSLYCNKPGDDETDVLIMGNAA